MTRGELGRAVLRHSSKNGMYFCNVESSSDKFCYLLQKQNDASYTGIDDISQYITGLELVDSSIIVTDAGASYTATIPKTNPKLSDNGAEITLPVLRFTIKTGSAFESGDLTYGNYRINVSVRLQKSDEPITNSEATNYVIYSNVKVIPYYID